MAIRAKSNRLRLNRYLAQAGVASRRKADALIAAGRIRVNGAVIRELGATVDPSACEVVLDGVPLDRPPAAKVYYLLNKPRGLVTTLSDPEGRPTVRDIFRERGRVFPVGRLDFDAEGVLLVTNDGDLAHRLTHPKYQVAKTYLVKVEGAPSPQTVTRLRRGIRLEDGFARPLRVSPERKTKEHSWFRMTVAEGRNRLIKRLWLRVGHPVRKLKRVDFAGLTLGDLEPGEFRPLTPQEVRKLKELGHSR